MTEPAGGERLLEEFVDSPAAIEGQAHVRYQSTDSYQSQLQTHYREMHHWYLPENGDHWPDDIVLRPDKIHVTANICRPVVEIDSRLQSILPRFTLPSATLSAEDRKRAEATESIMLQWLDMSGIDVWLGDLNRCRSIYGKGILRPYWDDDLKRGDVTLVENPANLRIGWGSSDYNTIDWTIYEYSLSAQEIMQRWPNVHVEPGLRDTDPPSVVVEGGTHADPLDQKQNEFWSPRYRQYTDYERKQIKIWDYWYKDKDGTPHNAMLVQGKLVDGPHAHDYLPDIPYIVIENDHEPGNPEGVSTIEPIIDVQEELNRLLSHGLQHVADDVDPAWYATGPTADSIDPGVAPKAGEMVGIGENKIEMWPKGVNTFPIREMLDEVWNYIRRETGISDIAFGDMPGADTSGRAIAIQVESMMNRLDPRRRRLYRGLKELLIFWTIMAERKDPHIQVDEETEASLGELVKGLRYWKIVAPEITPRDNIEMTQNEINKLNSKVTSHRDAMDAMGVENPEHVLGVIAAEHNDIDLHPDSVQIKFGVYSLMMQIMQMQQQMQMNQQQMAQQLEQMGNPQGTGGAPGSVLSQAQAATATGQQAAQAAQPTLFEDQNTPQPMTQAGTPAPAGAGAQATQIIRPNQGGQALNQVAFNQPIGA